MDISIHQNEIFYIIVCCFQFKNTVYKNVVVENTIRQTGKKIVRTGVEREKNKATNKKKSLLFQKLT
jgi:hypothetical protein